MKAFLVSHQGRSDEASIEISGDLLLSRKSLNSNHSGWKAYPLTLSAELRQSFTVTSKWVSSLYSSTCPASALHSSRHVAGLQFASKDFGNRIDRLSAAEIADWLGKLRKECRQPSQQKLGMGVSVS
ncbi:GTP cyclohydrolase, FolE2/MptA family [Klebsiella pneumoniae]